MFKSLLFFVLRSLSKRILRKYRPKVVGITGSVGKTSAKEAVAAVLATKYVVRASPKNYNNQIGVPLTIIGATQSPGKSLFGWVGVVARAFWLLISKDTNYPAVLVLEMGADRPGDIAYLVGIAPCDVGVLTSIAHAHTEFFKDIKGIVREKRVIISHLKSEGHAVVNFDNSFVMESASAAKAPVLTYGFKAGADMRASDVLILSNEQNNWPTGVNFKVTFKGSIVPVFLSGIICDSFIPAALAALAVGETFGVNLVDAAQALRKINPLPGHMRLVPGIKNTLVIDDTYNSSPDAAKVALNTLAKIPLRPGGERYAVLGDMLELGGETTNLHREIGLRVAELGIDFLITVGEASKHTAEAAREAGLSEHQVAVFADSTSAGKFLQDVLDEGDVVLVKGSQGVRMEKIVKEIMAEPLRAKEFLVRQEEEWLNK